MSLRLPSLDFAAWEPTKTTLHLYAQILGKIRLSCVPFQNHWWNVTLYPDARGLTTGLMRFEESLFELALDFVDHRAVLRTAAGRTDGFRLRHGLSVAQFYRNLRRVLERAGIAVPIHAVPYGVPVTAPFGEDREHASYDRRAVERFHRALAWTADVFRSYVSDFTGKASPIHLYWHSFDLATARFNGKPAPPKPPGTGIVEREAYSHEVIAAGFWAGDARIPFAAYYTYTAPEPETLTGEPLAGGGTWVPSGTGHLGILPYDRVRASTTPEATLLAFLRSGYDAGAKTAGWDPGLRK